MNRKKKIDWKEYWKDRVWIKSLSDNKWKEEDKTILDRLSFFFPIDDDKILGSVDNPLLLNTKTGELYEAKTIWMKKDKFEFEITNLRTQKAARWPKSKLWSKRSEFWIYYNDLSFFKAKAAVVGYIDLEKAFQTKVAIPNAGGVYFFFDGNKRLLYVGRTKNLNMRLRIHLNHIQTIGTVNYNWHNEGPHDFKFLCYIINDDPMHQTALEFYGIKHMKPLINVSRVKNAQFNLPKLCQIK